MCPAREVTSMVTIKAAHGTALIEEARYIFESLPHTLPRLMAATAEAKRQKRGKKNYGDNAPRRMVQGWPDLIAKLTRIASRQSILPPSPLCGRAGLYTSSA